MFQWEIYELTVVSVMRMYKLKRDFEWHEHIKLCHTRLYALAATLHKCALISNASHCCVRCMCATNLPGKNFFKSFQELHAPRRVQFLYFVPSSLSQALFLDISFGSSFASYFHSYTAFVAASMVFSSLRLKIAFGSSYMWETLMKINRTVNTVHTKYTSFFMLFFFFRLCIWC